MRAGASRLMNYKAYIYVAALTTAAVTVTASVPWSTIYDLTRHELIAVVVLVALIVLSEWLAVDYQIGSDRAVRSSMAFLPLLTCTILFPPAAAIFVAGVSSLITQLTTKGRAWWKVLANSSLAVVAIGIGALVYGLLGGAVGANFDVNVFAFFGLALTVSLINTLTVAGFYAVRNQSAFLSVFRKVIGPGAISIFYGLLASPIAVFAAYLYHLLDVSGLALITLPLLLIRYSYISKIQLQNSSRDLLKVLIKTIETRDPYTSGHSLRVSRLARLIAEDLNLPSKQVEKVETAALLHDIGKIDSVYAEIIQKRTALTDEEHRVIKTHAIKGAELLKNLTSLPDDVIRGVRHHHERYDGKGYPDGLAGKEIPIAARIIMLCDAIDAMLSDRPYRSAMSVEQVAEEIRRCAGTQFDPDIVSVVLHRQTLVRAAEQVRDEGGTLSEVVGS